MSRSTIIMVDDEPNILRALTRALDDDDLDLHTATSGAEGLELLDRHPAALVISDQRMPEMPGDEFLRRVRKKCPDAVRIVLTGYADMQAAISLINASGVHRYISKPWDDQDLRQIVRAALEHHRLVAENRRLQELTNRQHRELQDVSRQLAEQVAAQSSELRERNLALEKANRLLTDAQMGIIDAFTALIDQVSEQMGGHARRVAQWAVGLARLSEMDKEEIEQVHHAAMLHDLGRVGCHELMTREPRSLTAGDRKRWIEMGIRGETAILAIDALRPASIFIRHQHERWDGHGLPSGLAGERVPLGARILAVADAFDHELMRSKSRLISDEQQAWVTLHAKAGSLYDPNLCELLGSLIQDMKHDDGKWNDQQMSISYLRPGMLVSRDLLTHDGLLVAARGLILDDRMIRSIRRFFAAGRLDECVPVLDRQA